MLLKDKIFAITGGASGIGRAASLEAARQGADVAITDIVKPEIAQPVLEAIRRRAGRLSICRVMFLRPKLRAVSWRSLSRGWVGSISS